MRIFRKSGQLIFIAASALGVAMAVNAHAQPQQNVAASPGAIAAADGPNTANGGAALEPTQTAAPAPSGATAKPTEPPPSPETALISGPDGARITAAEFQADAQRIPPPARPEVLSQTRNIESALRNLYTRRRLALEAEREKIDQRPEVIAALQLARDKVLSDARIAEIDQKAEPSATALEAFAKTLYVAEPQRFMTPEEVRVRHILIKASEPDASATAEKLLEQIKGGADFATLAKENSADPGSAAKGGELGFIARGKTVAPFEKAAFALQEPGDLSPVVQTSFGYHIIALEARKAPALKPFDEVKAGLIAQARTKLLEEARQAKSIELLRGAELNEPAIEAFASQYGK